MKSRTKKTKKTFTQKLLYIINQEFPEFDNPTLFTDSIEISSAKDRPATVLCHQANGTTFFFKETSKGKLKLVIDTD